MLGSKAKYIRCKRFNEIIIFPEVLEHRAFKHFEPISAGFVNISIRDFSSGKPEPFLSVVCYGESDSLGLKSLGEEDAELVKRKILGMS